MKDSKYIDHTLLKATATREQIANLCAEANKYDFKSVCVNPYWVSFAHELLSGSDVLVCTVIGFPLGANTKDVKAYETTRAIADGADEVDMVINVGEAKAHNWNYVYEDIKAVVDAANGVTTKVIIETCYLTDEEKVEACKCAKRAGADFVKTSTGFGTGGATDEMIKAGASRIGASCGVQIVEGGSSNEQY